MPTRNLTLCSIYFRLMVYNKEVFMLNVQIAESLIGYITFFIAYCISISISGFFASWIILKMGDDTPEQAGFFTLNPMAHLDILGTLFLILYRFGWSRFIPINPFNIQGRHRALKVLTAFLAEPFAHFILGIISFISLLGIFGKGLLGDSITLVFAQSSSYVFSIGLILLEFFRVNIFLAVIVCLINLCSLAVILWSEKNPEYSVYANLIMFIIPLSLFYVFRNLIVILATALQQVSIFIGYLIASLLHLF